MVSDCLAVAGPAGLGFAWPPHSLLQCLFFLFRSVRACMLNRFTHV